jgi:hypothetical protein
MPHYAVSAAVIKHAQHTLFDAMVRYVQLPWTIVLNGKDSFESPLPSPAGIILFAFLPAGLFYLRKCRNKAMIACIAFALMYFVYWATILNVLRYAIALFAILALLLAHAATTFYDARNLMAAKLVRGSLLTVEVYCLLLATIAILIIEVNGPQIEYFAHRIDKAGYLRRALPTYGSLEFLQSAGESGGVFGIDNCSRAYAPGPLQFRCTLCVSGHCNAHDFANEFQKYKPSIVIVPEDLVLQNAVKEAYSNHTLVSIYHDQYFNAYRVQ